MAYVQQSGSMTNAAAGGLDRRSSRIVAAGTVAAILLIVATLIFIPRHQSAPAAAPGVSRAAAAQFSFVIRPGGGLVGHVGYDKAIDVAQRFSLEVRDHGRRISYAEARNPRLDRIHVEVLVQPGDRFDLQGGPADWRYVPAPPRRRLAGPTSR